MYYLISFPKDRFSSVSSNQHVTDTCNLQESTFEPAHRNLILFEKTNSEGSGEPPYLRSLARTFTACIFEASKQVKVHTKLGSFTRTLSIYTISTKSHELDHFIFDHQ